MGGGGGGEGGGGGWRIGDQLMEKGDKENVGEGSRESGGVFVCRMRSVFFFARVTVQIQGIGALAFQRGDRKAGAEGLRGRE